MMRLLRIVLLILIIGVIVNDGAKWAAAEVDLRNSTNTVIDKLTVGTRGMDQTALANRIAQEAAVQNIRVTQFSLTTTTLHLWSEEDVSGTLVLGPYLAISRGVPFQKAWSTPFAVHYDSEGVLR